MKVTSLQFILITLIAALAIGGNVYIGTRPRQVTSTDSHHPRGAEPPSTLDPGQTSANAGATPIGANGTGLQPTPDPAKRPNVFGLNGAVYLEDIPAGRFHDALSRLNEPARRYALDKLGRLRVPLNDVASLNVDKDGQLFYQCITPRLPPVPVITLASVHDESQGRLPGVTPDISVEEASVPIASPPIRHSRPGTTKVIYLDFNGHTITGTAWNNSKGSVGDANYRPAVASYAAKAFDTDGDPTTFSDTEQALIVQVWERVAEDYRGFDVDVTTESPASFTATTGRILITNSVDANGVNMPSSTAGGVAYLDVFGTGNYASYYSPALVYADLNNNYASYIAETASHEMGHNLSLSHDGTTTGDEYYNGQGGGETSWNTIMGGAYSENVTQWSKGEYYNANNQEDDLAIIAGHLGYGADDHSDSNATATPLTVSGLTVSGSGVISQTGEGDRFAFASGPGAIAITVSPFRSASQSYGGNLDVALELYDSTGNVVASTNPSDVTGATLNATVSGGTFYLKVYGAGNGTPLFGYSDYASLGWYTISGAAISTAPVAPTITSQPANQTVLEGEPAIFALSAGGFPTPTLQWRKNGVNISGVTGSTYSIASTTASDAATYDCIASNASGSVTSNGAVLAVGLRSVFTSRPLSRSVLEGQSATFTVAATGGGPFTYQWKHNRQTIAGASSSTLNLNAVSLSDRGYYEVFVTNASGVTIGTLFYLAVGVANPTIRVWGDRPPTPPATIESIAGIALGDATIAVKGDGRVVAWGDNSYGLVTVPANLDNVVAVASGLRHTLALKNDGTVVSWGDNLFGQVTLPVSLSGIVAIAAGNYNSLALKYDGTVVAWGNNDYGQTTIPAGLKNVVAIQTGRFFSLALRSDGTVVRWGYDFGQGNVVPGSVSDVISIAGGETHALALKRDGTVVAWGLEYAGSTVVPAGVSGILDIAAGGDFGLALKSNGTVIGWGRNYQGQTTLPPGLSEVIEIAAADWMSLALTRTPTIAPSNAIISITVQ